MTLTQVQLRLPKKTIEEIDQWVKEGRFKSRSDAIRTIISLYEERERTREFLTMLNTKSEEAERDGLAGGAEAARGARHERVGPTARASAPWIETAGRTRCR